MGILARLAAVRRSWGILARCSGLGTGANRGDSIRQVCHAGGQRDDRLILAAIAAPSPPEEPPRSRTPATPKPSITCPRR